jgi:hypothetical protein
MKEVCRRCALGAALILTAMNFLSCGHNELKLVSINVQPPSATFLTPDTNGQIVFTALGNYIHPPDTRDITDKVTWKTDVPGLIQINGGVASPNGGCGGANISASLQDNGNLVIAYATVTVNDPTNPICPGGGTEATLGVSVNPAGFGTVTSLTGGINCPSQCIAVFPVGTSVGLTATPTAGHSFVSWLGCTQSNLNTCTVTIPVGGASVAATFE